MAPLAIEEVSNAPLTIIPAPGEENLQIIDNDSLFCINRKFAAIESLFNLVSREYVPFGQMISEILRVALEQIRLLIALGIRPM